MGAAPNQWRSPSDRLARLLVADRILKWHSPVVSLGIRRLAVGETEILGLWLAVALVVLAALVVVYTLAGSRLVLVVGLVAVVDLGVVDLALAVLAFLVGNSV